MNTAFKLGVLAICGGMIACGSSQSPGAAVNPDISVKSLKVDYSPMESTGPMIIGSTIPVVSAPETIIPPFNVTLMLAGEPFAGKDVTLDFTDPALHLMTEQEAGTTVDCAKHTLTVTTDSAGVASFRPRFGGRIDAAGVSILLDTNIIGHAMATSTDLDGMNGTNDDDMNVLLSLIGKHGGGIAGDRDVNGKTEVNDLSLLLGAKAAGSYSASGYCP